KGAPPWLPRSYNKKLDELKCKQFFAGCPPCYREGVGERRGVSPPVRVWSWDGFVTRPLRPLGTATGRVANPSHEAPPLAYLRSRNGHVRDPGILGPACPEGAAGQHPDFAAGRRLGGAAGTGVGSAAAPLAPPGAAGVRGTHEDRAPGGVSRLPPRRHRRPRP